MRYTVLALLAFSLITNCGKNNSAPGSQGTMSATVGSSAFTANSTFGVYSSNLSSLVVIGFVRNGATDSTFLQLNLHYPLPVNQPFSTDTTSFDLSYYTASRAKAYDANKSSGHAIATISILYSVAHKITGTFSGTLLNDTNANDSIVITNGKFSTSYTAQ